MADSGGPEEDYAVIFSPGGSGSSIPPASPTDSSLGTPGDDPTGSPTTEVPTKPVGVVGKILSAWPLARLPGLPGCPLRELGLGNTT